MKNHSKLAHSRTHNCFQELQNRSYQCALRKKRTTTKMEHRTEISTCTCSEGDTKRFTDLRTSVSLASGKPDTDNIGVGTPTKKNKPKQVTIENPKSRQNDTTVCFLTRQTHQQIPSIGPQSSPSEWCADARLSEDTSLWNAHRHTQGHSSRMHTDYTRTPASRMQCKRHTRTDTHKNKLSRMDAYTHNDTYLPRFPSTRPQSLHSGCVDARLVGHASRARTSRPRRRANGLRTRRTSTRTR